MNIAFGGVPSALRNLLRRMRYTSKLSLQQRGGLFERPNNWRAHGVRA